MDATRIVEIAVGVLLIIVVISIAFQLKDTGASFAQSFASDLNRTTTSIEESKFTKYATSGLSGADVVSAIKQLSGEVIISVNTYKNESNKVTNNYSEAGLDGAHAAYEATPADASTGLYINPNAKFTGTIVRTGSGIIKGILFDQTAFVDAAVAVGPDSGSGSGSSGGTGGSGTGGSGTGGGGVTQTPNDQFNALSSQITVLTSQFTALNQTITDAIANGSFSGGGSGSGGSSQVTLAMFSALQGTVDANKANIDAFATSLQGVKDDIDALNSTISGMSGSGGGSSTGSDAVADLASQMEGIKTQIANLRAELLNEDADKPGEIIKLKDELTNLKGRLSNLENLVGNYPEGTKDKEAVITSLLAQIERIDGLISDYNELSEYFKKLEEQVNGGAPSDETVSPTSEPEPGTHY